MVARDEKSLHLRDGVGHQERCKVDVENWKYFHDIVPDTSRFKVATVSEGSVLDLNYRFKLLTNVVRLPKSRQSLIKVSIWLSMLFITDISCVLIWKLLMSSAPCEALVASSTNLWMIRNGLFCSRCNVLIYSRNNNLLQCDTALMPCTVHLSIIFNAFLCSLLQSELELLI